MDSNKIILFPVSIEELQNLISEAVRGQILNISNNSPPQNQEFLSRKETAKILRISLPTLTDYVMRAIIPAYRIGNNVRFRKDEVLNSIQKIQTTKYKQYK